MDYAAQRIGMHASRRVVHFWDMFLVQRQWQYMISKAEPKESNFGPSRRLPGVLEYLTNRWQKDA